MKFKLIIISAVVAGLGLGGVCLHYKNLADERAAHEAQVKKEAEEAARKKALAEEQERAAVAAAEEDKKAAERAALKEKQDAEEKAQRAAVADYYRRNEIVQALNGKLPKLKFDYQSQTWRANDYSSETHPNTYGPLVVYLRSLNAISPEDANDMAKRPAMYHYDPEERRFFTAEDYSDLLKRIERDNKEQARVNAIDKETQNLLDPPKPASQEVPQTYSVRSTGR